MGGARNVWGGSCWNLCCYLEVGLFMIPWGPIPQLRYLRPRRSVEVFIEVVQYARLCVLTLVSLVPDAVMNCVYWNENFTGGIPSDCFHDEVSQADIVVVQSTDTTDCPGYEATIIWRVLVNVGCVGDSSLNRSPSGRSELPFVLWRLCLPVSWRVGMVRVVMVF